MVLEASNVPKECGAERRGGPGWLPRHSAQMMVVMIMMVMVMMIMIMMMMMIIITIAFTTTISIMMCYHVLSTINYYYYYLLEMVMDVCLHVPEVQKSGGVLEERC